MIRPVRAVALAGATALLVPGLAACGESDREKQAERTLARAADLTTCQDAADPATKPYGRSFPAGWPFPTDTVVFHAEDRGSDSTVVTAISSAGFRSILDFMNEDVVAAGFRIEKGETEEHDAEAEWTGNGFRGRWAIRESASCPGQTVVQVLSAAR